MAQQFLDFGTAVDGDGEFLKTAFQKIEANFTELYGGAIGGVDGVVVADVFPDNIDSAVQINAAIDYVNANFPGGKVMLSAKTYAIDSPIVLKSGVYLEGVGKEATLLTAASGYSGNIIENSIPAESFERFLGVRGMTITGSGLLGTGLRLDTAAEVHIEDVYVTNCNYGFDFDHVITGRVVGCKLNANNYGFRQINECNAVVAINCRIQASKFTNVIIDGPASFAPQFYGVVIESSGITSPSPAVLIGDTEAVRGFLISGCYFENNRCGAGGGQIVIGGPEGGSVGQSSGSIIGGWITGHPTLGGIGIQVRRAFNTTILCVDTAGNTTAGIHFEDDASGCFLIPSNMSDPGNKLTGNLDAQTIISPSLSVARFQGNVRSNDTGNSRYGNEVGATVLSAGVGASIGFERSADFGGNNLLQVKGLAAALVPANNLGGQVTFAAAGTATVTFANAESNTSYRIVLGPAANEDIWWSNKTTNGFTINSSNASSVAVVDWLIFR